MPISSDPVIKEIIARSNSDILKFLKRDYKRAVFLPTEINQTARRGDHFLRIYTDNDVYICHVEFQASLDTTMDVRMHDYNFSYGRVYCPLRVVSILVLLTPGAYSKRITGSSVIGSGLHSYDIIKAWEQSVDEGLKLR